MQLNILILFIFGALFLAPFAHAQFSATPDPVQYIVAPESPGPNQPVFIEAQGVGSFLGNATITWQVNGKTVQSGAGLTTFNFTTGGVGSATTVHVIINSTTNGTMTHDFTFSPSVINLLWEADTSAPAFYIGKSLYSGGSQLKVVAYPTVMSGRSAVTSDKLSFQWSRGGTLDPSQSGLGKNTFTFAGDQLQTGENIAVDVLLGGAKVGHGELTIPVSTPQVILYNRDPLRGELLDFALPSSFSLNTGELTLQAEPYFFDNTSVRRGTVAYSWTLNNNDTTGPDTARGLLTLRQTGQGAGAAQVGVSAQNTEADRFVQAAQTLVQITFGQSSGTSIGSLFGL